MAPPDSALAVDGENRTEARAEPAPRDGPPNASRSAPARASRAGAVPAADQMRMRARSRSRRLDIGWNAMAQCAAQYGRPGADAWPQK